MSPFESYLIQIDERISLRDCDRQKYTNLYDRIRDYIMQIMRNQSLLFRQLYRGTTLFGSCTNGVRINKPTEFDVIFILSFPFSSEIILQPDPNRPGFVTLDFTYVFESLDDVNGYDELYEFLDNCCNNNLLNRAYLQTWLRDLIIDGLRTYGSVVRDCKGNNWKLQYTKRGLAHTIYAKCGSERISIDFVPDIKFLDFDFMDLSKLPNQPFNKWYACPKPSHGPQPKHYSFQICNPEVERTRLLQKQNLKIALRLLKSLFKMKGLHKMKSYFLTTAFLWEIDDEDESFWYQPVSKIFVHMLDRLDDYFEDGYLPFYWNEDLNLLDVLTADEIEFYAEVLRSALLTLQSYEHQPKLSFSTCASHFKISGYN